MPDHSEIKEPAPLLVRVADGLHRGKALDLAMGSGRNALYLAGLGFSVEGLDRDPDSVSACRRAAEARGLRIDARQVDLEQHRLPGGQYDLIICFYYLQRSLLPQIIHALKPGGTVVYETFLIDNHLELGHPRHREYCFAHNELLDSFRGLRILHYYEGPIPGPTFVAQLVAKKTEPVSGRGNPIL